MATKRDYEILARLKKKKKELENQIKEKENKIINNNPFANVETEHGVLKLTTRSNYCVPSNTALLYYSEITQNDFMKSAKMPISEIKKLIGEKKFHQLIEENVIEEKKPTTYYSLKEKSNNE